MPYKAINLDTGDILRSDLFSQATEIRGKHPNIGCPYCKKKMSARGGFGTKVKVYFYHIRKGDDCFYTEYYQKKFRGDKQKQNIHEMTVESVLSAFITHNPHERL